MLITLGDQTNKLKSIKAESLSESFLRSLDSFRESFVGILLEYLFWDREVRRHLKRLVWTSHPFHIWINADVNDFDVNLI